MAFSFSWVSFSQELSFISSHLLPPINKSLFIYSIKTVFWVSASCRSLSWGFLRWRMYSIYHSCSAGWQGEGQYFNIFIIEGKNDEWIANALQGFRGGSVDFWLEVREYFLHDMEFEPDLEEWEILRQVNIGEGSLGRAQGCVIWDGSVILCDQFREDERLEER